MKLADLGLRWQAKRNTAFRPRQKRRRRFACLKIADGVLERAPPGRALSIFRRALKGENVPEVYAATGVGFNNAHCKLNCSVIALKF